MLASPRRILFAYGQDAEDITVQSRRPHSILTQLRARGSVVNVSPLNQSAIRLLAPLELLFGAFGLILNTTSAHSYSFISPNVGTGVYTVDIQLGVDANANVSGSGTAIGAAAYGLGSLTVESVRLVNDFSF